MSKPRVTSEEITSIITNSVLKFSAEATQQIGDLLSLRESSEVLKLNFDILMPHIAVAEYGLEQDNYWDLDDHKLPSNVAIDDLVTFLSNARIPTYKNLWARDSENLSQNSAMTDLLQEIYQHWHGEEPPARELSALQFHIVLEGSLSGLGLLITKACHDIDLR